MKAGRYPENGASRLTIRVYRVDSDSERVDSVRQLTVLRAHDPERVRESLDWPPCSCAGCRSGHLPKLP